MEATHLLDLGGLQGLIDALTARGYRVIGPTVRDGTIVLAPVTTVDDLPRGWGDEQDAAHYRLRRRDDEALFGFAAPPQAVKQVLFPAEELIWRGRRTGTDFAVDERGVAESDNQPYAFLGARSCDLRAMAIHDTVLLGRQYVDVRYGARREGAFVVAVTCSDPAGTCFCVSTGGGPRPDAGYDLALAELLDGGDHRFVVTVGTDRGAQVLAEVPSRPVTIDEIVAADEVAVRAAGRMGRTLDTDGIKEVLYAAAESPRWDDVASRCLACTNCTMVCPTCFCTSVEDVADLTGDVAERHRVWDSCFSEDFSYIHGGSIRPEIRSRYRQWLTHKLASWIDQFGMSGCVGCGRCITWCPAAIDITAEAAALRWVAQPALAPASGAPPAPGPVRTTGGA
ncbi:4Fe-4S dicluster domain-containing protein [Cellulomonas sp. KRMCY2]|uniref:4Fe-4S dicluster domain-containing protein n=1 Tax=Cellulomonas sp. KRMCY2 TaxID=1304865 RepID=UPI00045E889D|nr:4Fe-4S dicluster domain-containing protein [Cellulomonas sp. KRMCY2]